jgi:hypothetical protein
MPPNSQSPLAAVAQVGDDELLGPVELAVQVSS